MDPGPRPGSCPECVNGKHGNCPGWAYDSDDNEGPCLCEQYQHTFLSLEPEPPVNVRVVTGAGDVGVECIYLGWDGTDVWEAIIPPGLNVTGVTCDVMPAHCSIQGRLGIIEEEQPS